MTDTSRIAQPVPRFGIPDAALVLATACWGLNFVITKSATGAGPEDLRLFIYNIIRFPIAAVLLFITARAKGQTVVIPRRRLFQLAMLSLVGIFIYQILYMVGQYLTSSANVGIFYGSMPLLILTVSVVFRIERPSLFMVAGVLTGALGLGVILFEGGSFSLDVGSLLVLLAFMCWSFYAVFGKPVLDAVPPVVATGWIMLFGSFYQLPLALWQLPGQTWHTLAGETVLFVLMSALFSLYTGYTLFYYGVKEIGPARAGVYTNLVPFFTILFAVLIRHEHIHLFQVAGLLVILSGIVLTKIRR